MVEKVKFRINNGVGRGFVVKNNTYTLWVRLNDGNVIKRHRFKHTIVYV